MSPAALLVLVALGAWFLSSVQTPAHRRRSGPARNPYTRRRRAPRRVPASAQPNPGDGRRVTSLRAKRGKYATVLADPPWDYRDSGRTGSALPASAQPNPYTQACALPGGHVYDFTAGGRCQCCGRMAPKRTVELEARTGEHARYGSTCAGRSIGTTKLRTNQLAHIDREASERTAQRARYRGVRSERYGRLEGGVDRPPWAVGLTDAQLQRIARDHGVNASSEGWWEAAGLVRGSGELRELLREGGYRKQYSGKGSRGARGGRLERVPVSRSERARHRAIAAASALGAGADLPF